MKCRPPEDVARPEVPLGNVIRLVYWHLGVRALGIRRNRHVTKHDRHRQEHECATTTRARRAKGRRGSAWLDKAKRQICRFRGE